MTIITKLRIWNLLRYVLLGYVLADSFVYRSWIDVAMLCVFGMTAGVETCLAEYVAEQRKEETTCK